MTWKNTLRKAPPIENPRKEGERFPNDNLSDDEFKELFEDVIDASINLAEPSSTYVSVFADHLKMSKEKALEKIRQFYTPEMGYPKVEAGSIDSIHIFLE
jgi:hypothetical protein